MNTTQIKSFLSKAKENWQAALAVALINLPLSIALAVASLGSADASIPMMGIITAIFGGIAASIFASSKHNIYGPAGAITAVLIAFVTAVNGDLLLVPVLAIFTAVISYIIYKLKISKYITLIPTSALSGFLMGVGLIIMFTQLNNALGIVAKEKHDTFFANVWQTFSQFSGIHWPSFLVFIASFLFLMLYRKFSIAKKIPGAIPVTVFGIAFGYMISTFPSITFFSGVETLKTSFEGLSFYVADFSYINGLQEKIVNIDTLYLLVKFAAIIAIIAILETLITAKAIAKKTKTHFSKDKEIFGLAASNLASGFAGGMPASAVIVRTIFNADSGANSRVAAFMGSVIVLVIAFLFFDLFAYIPMPVIAAILVNISIGLIDTKELSRFRNLDKLSFFIAFIVAFVTLVEDPMTGIISGTVVALLFFIRDVSKGNIDISIFRNGVFIDKMPLVKYLENQNIQDSLIFRFPATINYINSEVFLERIQEVKNIKNVVFSFGQVVIVDIDGIELLDEAVKHFEEKGIEIYFTGIISERLKNILKDKKYYRDLKENGKVYKSSAFVISKIKKDI